MLKLARSQRHDIVYLDLGMKANYCIKQEFHKEKGARFPSFFFFFEEAYVSEKFAGEKLTRLWGLFGDTNVVLFSFYADISQAGMVVLKNKVAA